MHESYLEMLETKPSMTNDRSPEKRPDKKDVFTNYLEQEQPKPRHIFPKHPSIEYIKMLIQEKKFCQNRK